VKADVGEWRVLPIFTFLGMRMTAFSENCFRRHSSVMGHLKQNKSKEGWATQPSPSNAEYNSALKLTVCDEFQESKKRIPLLRGHLLPDNLVGGHPGFD